MLEQLGPGGETFSASRIVDRAWQVVTQQSNTETQRDLSRGEVIRLRHLEEKIRRERVGLGEQSQEDIDYVREGIKAIYESQEVKDTLYERWISSKKPIDVIHIKKGRYAFTLTPGLNDTSEGLSPLKLSRIELGEDGKYKIGSVLKVDATSRDIIKGFGHYEVMQMVNIVDLLPQDAIAVGRELIQSFNTSLPQES